MPARNGAPVFSKADIKHYMTILLLLWTAAVVCSAVWSALRLRRTAMEMALTRARTAYEKDVLYREWNAGLGGVYARVSADVEPNPYLEVEDRDLETVEGEMLTLLSPARMTRQVHELQAEKEGVKGHITSLYPLRPANAADRWETRALREFLRGAEEVSSVERMAGEEYLRLMRPLRVEASCLKCHAKQGYKEGDIRGGISVSIPLRASRQLVRLEEWGIASSHGLLWLFGTTALLIGSSSIGRRVGERDRAEQSFRDTHAALLSESEEREKLQEELLRVQAAVDDASDGVVIMSIGERHVLYSNGALADMFGKTADAIEEDGLESVFREPEMVDALFASVAGGVNENVEAEMLRGESEAFTALLRATAILDQDHNVQGVLFMFTDITVRKELEEQLRRTASIDALTEVANRRSFDEALENEWLRAKRNKTPVSMIMADIDFFKKYNDSLGHVDGDECLKKVARVLQRVVRRPGDFVARYGGEEFAVVLADTSNQGAAIIAETMRAGVEALGVQHPDSPTAPNVTISLGVTTRVPLPQDKAEELVKSADQALYKAKQGGRNRVVAAA